MSEPKQTQAIEKAQPGVSLLATIARNYDMEPKSLNAAIRQVIFPPQDRKGNAPTDAQVLVYLSVCHHNGLDPFSGMCWPFPMRDGGFKPVTSIDGWLFIQNNDPQFDGYDYDEKLQDNGEPIYGEIKIFRKDRSKPTVHREYFKEAYRDTEPWKKQPHRMLENRTTVQGIRRAFGVKGMMDAEEAERGEEVNITAQSIEMERTTAEKTTDLKNRLSNAGKASTASIPDPPIQPVIPITPEPAQALVSNEPPPNVPVQEQAPIPSSDSLFESMPARNPDEIITGEESAAFIDTMRAKAGDNDALKKEVNFEYKQVLQRFGYTKASEIKIKDYPAMLKWAQELDLTKFAGPTK
jgi:hypothetical protein